MGVLDRFRRAPVQTLATRGRVPYMAQDAYMETRFASESILGLSAAQMWQTQPYLRTVVTFLARNVAQLGLHTYQRVGEHDRRRVRDGIAEVLARPNASATTFELVYGLVADLALYDRAYWLLGTEDGAYLHRVPVTWVEPVANEDGHDLAPSAFRVWKNDRGEWVTVPAEMVLYFHGWTPDSLAYGSTPVHALKEILAEQVQAAKYREMVWRRGGKVGSVLSRPADSPEWSPEAKKQFKADWDARFTGDGPDVGGTPLLEDGMTLNRVDFSAHEMEFVEGARLALNTVASVYHVNPTMIGLLDNANYSNVREFRRMLYGDTLGPILAQVEDRLNTFLVPLYDDRPGIYVEFNLEEKLQGSFEEQTVALQAAVGAPWMTRNEARGVRNMPAVEGGDELITPLNVLEGGQASPVDSAPPPTPGQALGAAGGQAVIKAHPELSLPSEAERIAATLRRFFTRQRDADRFGRGGAWAGSRWDRELTEDLEGIGLEGLAPAMAQDINQVTKAALDEQLAASVPDLAGVYRVAIDSRAAETAAGLDALLQALARLA